MNTLLVTGLLASLIGVVLGLVGGGGGILAVPVLVYVAGLAVKPAIATSLLFVGATSAFGAVLAAREGRVRWRLGLQFAAASMAGAFVGGRLAQLVPERVLMGTLGVVMLLTALRMLRARTEGAPTPRASALGRMLSLGVGVGVLSGFVGAGGGFLIVPALTILGGLAMREAIGTSLFIIALQSFAGFAGHAAHVDLDGRLVGVMIGAAVAGTLLGSSIGKRLSGAALKLGFALLVLATGLLTLGRQLPPVWTILIGVAAVSAAVVLSRRPAPTPAPPSS